jgi:cyclopropane-fatty-acyl-phospholipid synthase
MSISAERIPSEASRLDIGAAVAFLTRLFPPPREFAIRLWDGTTIPAREEPRFTLVIASAPDLRAMFRPPAEASLADAYIAGRLEVEGDLTAVFGIVEACRRGVRSPGDLVRLASLWRALPVAATRKGGPAISPAPLPGGTHSPERDSAAVRHHYDLGNDFYQLFLDSRMIYSCAYFRTGAEDLETAQLLKLEHICRKLSLRAGERLLDVGCGWGGLLIHAARNHGISGVGITLSQRQFELARQRVTAAGLDDRVEIRLADYRTLGGETFDKAASVGMFEHVGEARLAEYFSRVYGVVRPGGLFLNHGISIQKVRPRNDLRTLLRDPLNRLLVGTSPLTRSVFPDTELVPLSDVNGRAEDAGWEVRDVENLREHYATTLRHWIHNLEAHEEDAVRIVGRPTFRAWRLYFAASAYRFDIGRISVNQTLLARLDGGRAGVPPSRAHIYAERR